MFQRLSLAVLLFASLVFPSTFAVSGGRPALAAVPDAHGGLVWSTERASPQRTGLSTATGPDQPVFLWSAGFIWPYGEPVVGPGGRVYGRGDRGCTRTTRTGRESGGAGPGRERPRPWRPAAEST